MTVAARFVQPDGSTLTERQRRVLGADLTVRYQPLRNNQFKSLTWGTELLYSDNRYLVNPTGNRATLIRPAPLAPLACTRISPTSSTGSGQPGSCFEWVENPQNNHDKTSAYSPYITWALSHWNQLRLQYTHTDHNAAIRPAKR